MFSYDRCFHLGFKNYLHRKTLGDSNNDVRMIITHPKLFTVRVLLIRINSRNMTKLWGNEIDVEVVKLGAQRLLRSTFQIDSLT